MKKLVGILALTAVTTSLFAQGLVSFNNSSAVGPVKKWTSSTDSTLVSVPKTVGGVVNARVEVLAFYNSTTASLTPLFETGANGFVTPNFDTLAAFLAGNAGWAAYSTVGIGSLQNGVFNTGTVTVGTVDGPGGTSLDGQSVRYAIVGWSGNYATYEDALAAAFIPGNTVFMGISSAFTTASGNPYTTPPGTAQSISGTFTGFNLAPVNIPEPGSFALAGLGLAALLVFRRRN